MGTFPAAPLRTARESFDLKQLSSWRHPLGSAMCISHSFPFKCRQPVPLRHVVGSPHLKLLRGLRSPGTRVLEAIPRSVDVERIERDVGAPFIHFNELTVHRLSGGDYASQKLIDTLLTAPLPDAIAMSVRFHPWRLGFKQSSFHHIARALQDHIVSVFRCLLLF
jgi:hypothetical protein